MAVHAFTPGFESYILLVATSIICLVGLYLLVSQWGHGRPCRFFSFWGKEAFRDGARVFFQILILDVLLFRRTWKQSKRRWAIHMAIFWVFIFFGGFIILSIFALVLLYLDPNGLGGNVSHYLTNLYLPYSLLEYLILAACSIALLRRLLVKKVRERTGFSDLFLVGSVCIIVVTGTIAEWFSGYDILVGPVIKNLDLALEFLSLHLYAVFLLFVMTIPWSRFRHIIATPLVLLARRGGD